MFSRLAIVSISTCI